jgi:hypothetical protein
MCTKAKELLRHRPQGDEAKVRASIFAICRGVSAMLLPCQPFKDRS